MTARLPTPGSDDNTWGDILNTYLSVSLAADGTVNAGVIGATQIASGAITTTQISATAGIIKTQLASAVQTSLSAADAAAVNTAVVHLTGNETIAGIKTFSSSPSLPTPVNAGDGATKGYVDGKAGGITRSVVNITAAQTAGGTALIDYVYYWSGSSAFTLTMPTAVSNTNRYTLKNASTVNQTVNTTASQTIEGGTSIVIYPNNSVDLISNGANWMVI